MSYRAYDCFLFFNELDLLELRLKTLDAVVDYFVLVEAPWTFSGKEKPLHFKENYARFRYWLPKIRHVLLQGEPRTKDPWEREYLSREAMKSGFPDAQPDDLIFQSDVDEIWRPEKKLDRLGDAKVLVYEMYHAYYYLNTERWPRVDWKGTRRLKAKDWTNGQAIRRIKGPRIKDGGWHFSFLGDAENAKTKLEAYAHTEYSGPKWTDVERNRDLMAKGIDILQPGAATYQPRPVDETFPKPVLEDHGRWSGYVKAVY